MWSSLLNVNSTALLTFVKTLLVILAKKSPRRSAAPDISRKGVPPERGGLAAGGVQGFHALPLPVLQEVHLIHLGGVRHARLHAAQGRRPAPSDRSAPRRRSPEPEADGAV